MIGLMGCSDDGVLYTPSGKVIVRLPLWIARRVQAAQHWISNVSRRFA